MYALLDDDRPSLRVSCPASTTIAMVQSKMNGSFDELHAHCGFCVRVFANDTVAGFDGSMSRKTNTCDKLRQRKSGYIETI
jgi:hypothetical protein